MNFSTVSFLFYFLPLALILYGAAGSTGNMKYKNMTLLALSCLFYGWCGVRYLMLYAVMISINYPAAKHLKKAAGRKSFLCIAGLDLWILAFFKYFNFFAENAACAIRASGGDAAALHTVKIPLPLGISFFVFQMLSYLADVYRGGAEEKSFVDFALFMMFFPQLVQGPILRYQDAAGWLKNGAPSFEDLEYGAERFIKGFVKKVLIADQLLPVSDAVFAAAETGIPAGYAWLGIICYALVIYYDFSGYSDMAAGLCRIFGFRIKENFDHPYAAASLQEFWRKWHISLSSWFRDYVYIPLGGNRKGKAAACRNLMIVFLLTGLWHGAGWTFIAWGAFHGAFRLLEQMGLKEKLEKLPAAAGHIYTMLVVLTGWVFFRADSLEQAFLYIKSMFVPTDAGYAQLEILRHINKETAAVLLMGCILAVPRHGRLPAGFDAEKRIRCKKAVYFAAFIIAVSVMMGSAFHPSIYAKF